MPDNLGVNPMLQQQARHDRGGVVTELERRSQLAGVQKDFSQSAITETGGCRAVVMPFKLKGEGGVCATVRKALPVAHDLAFQFTRIVCSDSNSAALTVSHRAQAIGSINSL